MSRRGKSQARRNSGSGGGSLPGWAWMVLGIVLTVGVILAAPKFLAGEGEDGFFRPKANPDAQPVAAENEDTDIAAPEQGDASPRARSAAESDDTPDYDFYELLPGEEVALTDAQLAAAARAEQERARRERERLARQAGEEEDAQDVGRPQPLPETSTAGTADTRAVTATSAATPAPSGTSSGNDTPYVLQAGAFGASGDAEAVKARIALLGLNARVESAQIGGKTVYRVRMGPYGTASELAAAKGKLASGGLPALAIKAR
ncbi:MAG TPA: SPOR domain-containing protein [Xanthomonadaceae bacterium]|nr:SPOR domain-containing protein [Xanthomonadaceae bacterium]